MDSVCRRGATLPGCVTVQRWLAVAYFAHPMYLQFLCNFGGFGSRKNRIRSALVADLH